MSLPDLSKISLRDYASPVGKKSDLAYQALKRMIMLRHYPPETQIIEQRLAEELCCSQSTIREALLNLTKDGLVERRGYRGTVVTDTSLDEAAAMVEVRLTIERAVASSVFARQKHLDKGNLNKLFDQMGQAHKDSDLYLGSELDRAFHSELARAAGMNLLSPILERCTLHIHRFTLGSVEVPRDFFQQAGIGEEHRVLLEKICAGPSEEAEMAITRHLAHVLQRWSPSLYGKVGTDVWNVIGL